MKPGGTLAVIAPATPFDRDIFEAGVKRLEEGGYRLRIDPRVYLSTRYTSGSPEERAAVIEAALTDPEVEGIIAARGGYGTVHVLAHLDFDLFSRHPKRIVGCSDLTTLLQAVYHEAGVAVYHGPMVAGDFGRGPSDETWNDFVATLAGEHSSAKDRDLEVLCGGTAEGPLTGGCLSLLRASIGTPYEFHANGGLLFIEDIREHPYKIDRMLTQLLLAGKFDDAAGLVFGQMEGCEAPEGSDYRLQEVIFDLLNPLGIPVYFGYPSGHAQPNLTLPLGPIAKMVDGRLRSVGDF